MSDLYAEQLEMQLRFAEEESQEREMVAYEQGKADGVREFAEWLLKHNKFDLAERMLLIQQGIDSLIAEYEKENQNEQKIEFIPVMNVDEIPFENTKETCAEKVLEILKEQNDGTR